MMQDNSLRRIYLGIAIVSVVGIVLVLVTMLVIVPIVEYSNKMAYLDILVEPNNATVEIAGQEYRNAVYEAEPGNYTVTVTGEGMAPVDYTVELKKNETTGLYLRLSDAGEWVQSSAEEVRHRNSIESVLPLYFSVCGTPAKRTNCDAVSINYDRALGCRYDKCLIVSGRTSELSSEVLAEVSRQLSDRGYNLDDYQYIYTQNDNR